MWVELLYLSCFHILSSWLQPQAKWNFWIELKFQIVILLIKVSCHVWKNPQNAQFAQDFFALLIASFLTSSSYFASCCYENQLFLQELKIKHAGWAQTIQLHQNLSSTFCSTLLTHQQNMVQQNTKPEQKMQIGARPFLWFPQGYRDDKGIHLNNGEENSVTLNLNLLNLIKLF